MPGRSTNGLRALVRPALESVTPYDPGPGVADLEGRYGVERLVKLNWNEDLFGLLPGVRDAVVAELANASLYPEQAYTSFRSLVAAWAGTDAEMVLPAHGIQALVLATVAVFVNPGDKVVLPSPTYGLYRQACVAAGAEIVTVATRGYRLDLEQMAAAAHGAKLVFVCDPNNPTGDTLSVEEWSYFVENLPSGCLAVVDEAYADYMAPAERPHRVDEIAAGRPLVLLRTFSKLFGLAGLRLGYAIVHHDLVPCYDAIQEPFNVNRLALAAGTACLAYPRAVETRRLEVIEARTMLAAELAALGIPSWPSKANFILAEPGGDDLSWYEGLVRRGFLVRPGSEFGLEGHLRITIGPREMMASLATALGEVSDEISAGGAPQRI
ncbi:MAG: pyridoxal phosphate-dependent aminotransferase [Acidimicrobiales bacterium]